MKGAEAGFRIYECAGEEGYHVTIKENVLFTKKEKKCERIQPLSSTGPLAKYRPGQTGSPAPSAPREKRLEPESKI